MSQMPNVLNGLKLCLSPTSSSSACLWASLLGEKRRWGLESLGKGALSLSHWPFLCFLLVLIKNLILAFTS